MTFDLDSIRDCLEGSVPSAVATCAPDGTPNVTYVSQVHFVDSTHVALSFQFFNKTRKNILRNPRASAIVVHPRTAAQYRLELEYERTEESGPLFESMKAKLAGIASHTGMSGVFQLQGSDVYRVRRLCTLPGESVPDPGPRKTSVATLRRFTDTLTRAADLDALLESALSGLESHFGIRHTMILMADAGGRKLYTVASRGYDASGIGSEIPFGYGVIGVSAEHRVPIRISHMTAEYSYGRAVRDSAVRDGSFQHLETAIPLPGLPESRSQLAVPVLAVGQLVGVLYAESTEDLRFGYDDEDALDVIASQLGAATKALERLAEVHDTPDAASTDVRVSSGLPVTIRHYGADDSIFIDGDYLIKGVAGAILGKLLSTHANEGRRDFCNRELRLDPQLQLPDVTDNLEARLILLTRRLVEKSAPVRIEKTGRGRFRLRLDRPYDLVEVE